MKWTPRKAWVRLRAKQTPQNVKPHWMDEPPPKGMTWGEIADRALPEALRTESITLAERKYGE